MLLNSRGEMVFQPLELASSLFQETSLEFKSQPLALKLYLLLIYFSLLVISKLLLDLIQSSKGYQVQYTITSWTLVTKTIIIIQFYQFFF